MEHVAVLQRLIWDGGTLHADPDHGPDVYGPFATAVAAAEWAAVPQHDDSFDIFTIEPLDIVLAGDPDIRYWRRTADGTVVSNDGGWERTLEYPDAN